MPGTAIDETYLMRFNMIIQCVDCRHFHSEPHGPWDGYCTFVPPATLAGAIGLEHHDDIAATAVTDTDTCSLAAPKGDGE